MIITIITVTLLSLGAWVAIDAIGVLLIVLFASLGWYRAADMACDFGEFIHPITFLGVMDRIIGD